MITLYYSFVYPYLSYCNHIWGNIYQTNVDNYVLRRIKSWGLLSVWSQGRVLFPYMNPLVSWNSMTPLRNWLQDLCTNSVGMVPKLFWSYFVRNFDVSSYDLRSSNRFHLQIIISDLCKNGVRYRGGSAFFIKLLTEGFSHTVSEAVFVKQLLVKHQNRYVVILLISNFHRNFKTKTLQEALFT